MTRVRLLEVWEAQGGSTPIVSYITDSLGNILTDASGNLLVAAT